MKKIFFIGLCIVSNTCSFASSDKTFYYKDEYSLALVKSGVDTFLNKVKTLDDVVYIKSVITVIELSELNGMNVATLLSNLQKKLSARITKIERLNEKNLDEEAILYGLLLLFAWLVIAGILRYFHRNHFLPLLQELKIKESAFTHEGVGIERNRRGVTIVTSSDSEMIDMALAKEIFELEGKRKKYVDRIWAIGFLSLLLPYFAYHKIHDGFHPHNDDAFLAKYKDLLECTLYIEQKIKDGEIKVPGK